MPDNGFSRLTPHVTLIVQEVCDERFGRRRVLRAHSMVSPSRRGFRRTPISSGGQGPDELAEPWGSAGTVPSEDQRVAERIGWVVKKTILLFDVRGEDERDNPGVRSYAITMPDSGVVLGRPLRQGRRVD